MVKLAIMKNKIERRLNMKENVKLYDVKTYPNSLLDYLEAHKEMFYNTFSSGKVEFCPHELYQEMTKILENEYFYAIHASRIIDPASILQKGLLIPASSEYLLNQLCDNLRSILESEIINKVKNTLYKNVMENDITAKYDKLWFIIGSKEDITIDRLWMLNKYGGELLEDIFTKLEMRDVYEEKVSQLGKPTMIEFSLKFDEIEQLHQQEIINRMIEIIVFKNQRKEFFVSAYTQNIIPKEQIISILQYPLDEFKAE